MANSCRGCGVPIKHPAKKCPDCLKKIRCKCGAKKHQQAEMCHKCRYNLHDKEYDEFDLIPTDVICAHDGCERIKTINIPPNETPSKWHYCDYCHSHLPPSERNNFDMYRKLQNTVGEDAPVLMGSIECSISAQPKGGLF